MVIVNSCFDDQVFVSLVRDGLKFKRNGYLYLVKAESKGGIDKKENFFGLNFALDVIRENPKEVPSPTSGGFLYISN